MRGPRAQRSFSRRYQRRFAGSVRAIISSFEPGPLCDRHLCLASRVEDLIRSGELPHLAPLPDPGALYALCVTAEESAAMTPVERGELVMAFQGAFDDLRRRALTSTRHQPHVQHYPAHSVLVHTLWYGTAEKPRSGSLLNRLLRLLRPLTKMAARPVDTPDRETS